MGRIDPGHIADGEGRRYVHLSAGYAVEVSSDGQRAISSPTQVYEGWPIPGDWTIECFCLELPKLTRHGGWYYLTNAQGGTSGPATSHMVVSARSKGPLGPWENSPYNPIIRTWDRDEAWWSKGHGTLVEGPGNDWYCVLHGYMNGYRTLGRCTLIEPIQWTADGWFRAADGWPNEAQDVRFYYKSIDGDGIILQPGMDVSSMTTVGWHALRPALFSTGTAKTRFSYFRYRSLDWILRSVEIGSN